MAVASVSGWLFIISAYLNLFLVQLSIDDWIFFLAPEARSSTLSSSLWRTCYIQEATSEGSGEKKIQCSMEAEGAISPSML